MPAPRSSDDGVGTDRLSQRCAVRRVSFGIKGHRTMASHGQIAHASCLREPRAAGVYHARSDRRRPPDQQCSTQACASKPPSCRRAPKCRRLSNRRRLSSHHNASDRCRQVFGSSVCRAAMLTMRAVCSAWLSIGAANGARESVIDRWTQPEQDGVEPLKAEEPERQTDADDQATGFEEQPPIGPGRRRIATSRAVSRRPPPTRGSATPDLQ